MWTRRWRRCSGSAVIRRNCNVVRACAAWGSREQKFGLLASRGAECVGMALSRTTKAARLGGFVSFLCHHIRENWVFARSGGELLSHVLRRSTIAAAALNFRVREGTGCFARAMATRPREYPKCRRTLGIPSVGEVSVFWVQKARPHTVEFQVRSAHAEERHAPLRSAFYINVLFKQACFLVRSCLSFSRSNQAYRAISTGQLNVSLRLHLRPIDVVVYHGPQGDLVLRGASRLDAFSGYPVRS